MEKIKQASVRFPLISQLRKSASPPLSLSSFLTLVRDHQLQNLFKCQIEIASGIFAVSCYYYFSFWFDDVPGQSSFLSRNLFTVVPNPSAFVKNPITTPVFDLRSIEILPVVFSSFLFFFSFTKLVHSCSFLCMWIIVANMCN